MAEWLIERGIGESRAILVEHGRIIAARVHWPGGLEPGLVAEAQIVHRRAGSRRGTARFEGGAEALVDGLPADATEGARLLLRITRAGLGERDRAKLPQAKPAPGARPRAAPDLAERLAASPWPLHEAMPADGRLDAAGWPELAGEAFAGTVAFPGGALTIHPTPAMTLIDIDGALEPRALALAAAPAIAATLDRLELAGSVGIDFPTLASRADRLAVDAALGEALDQLPLWRGERTAINGFGLVQLVAKRESAGFGALYALHPAAAAARMLLRRAEQVREPGTLLLTASHIVREAVRPDQEAELARRTGRALEWATDRALAPDGAFAQAVTR